MSKSSVSVLALIVSCFITACPAVAKDPPAKPAPAAVPVKTAPVARKDMPVLIRAVGTVVPRQTVAVKSRIDSQIMEVRFKDGDMVKEGDTLFVLDDRVLRAQLVEAQANMQRDKAQLTNLEQQYARADKLAGQGYATGATRDEAKAGLEAQKAVVSADNASMESIKVQLGYTLIKAPIAGRTGTIAATVGNTVRANDTAALVTINQIQPVLVQASLPQASFNAVRAAMTTGDVAATAAKDDGTQAGAGSLQYIDNAIDQGTGTYVTRAIFENKEEQLWPGMLVNLSIALKEDKQVQVVPEVAIQHSPDGDFVYAIADGKAVRKPVSVTRMQNGLAIIAKGLDDKDTIVTDGYMSLKDGSAVATQ